MHEVERFEKIHLTHILLGILLSIITYVYCVVEILALFLLQLLSYVCRRSTSSGRLYRVIFRKEDSKNALYEGKDDTAR